MAGLLQGVLPGGRIWHTTSLERTRGDATPARGWERGIGAQRGAGSQVVALRVGPMESEGGKAQRTHLEASPGFPVCGGALPPGGQA